MEPYIDAHSHVWTDDLGHYPLGNGWTREDMEPPSFTAERLLSLCRPNGVGRVNLIQMSYYVDKIKTSDNPTRFDNRYMLDMIKLYPDRFVGTAIIDPLAPKPDRAMAELRPKGVRAFRIQPEYSRQLPERWLQPEGYRAMFAEAARNRQAMSCLIDPRGFAEIDRMCGLFPDTPVIIDHFGRVGVDGTIRDADLDALCGLAKHPRVYIKTGAFYALGEKAAPYLDLAPMIRRVVQAFGPRRCMWESDCPFQVQPPHTYADSIALVRDRLDFLSAEDRSWLLGKTAEALLFAG